LVVDFLSRFNQDFFSFLSFLFWTSGVELLSELDDTISFGGGAGKVALRARGEFDPSPTVAKGGIGGGGKFGGGGLNGGGATVLFGIVVELVFGEETEAGLIAATVERRFCCSFCIDCCNSSELL
jgi:hypothetical protein